jgi:hypothetical protein
MGETAGVGVENPRRWDGDKYDGRPSGNFLKGKLFGFEFVTAVTMERAIPWYAAALAYAADVAMLCLFVLSC